jgi:hypothetical protein
MRLRHASRGVFPLHQPLTFDGGVRSEKAASCWGLSGQRFSMYARKHADQVMRINMSDSLPGVNEARAGFGIIIHEPARSTNVHGNRDDVISSFVRMRIREWRVSGRALQDLAREAGFAKSTPSQVILGTGVGAKTGPRFARAFGFRSYDDMKAAAWEWWKAQGRAGSEAIDFPHTDAMRDAVEAVLSLKQGTREQLETILSAFSHERFRSRDQDWWLQTLLAELGRDRLAVREGKATRADVADKQKQMRELRDENARLRAPPAAAKRKRAS